MENQTEQISDYLYRMYKDKGWNEQERNAADADYVKKYFQVYPNLKKKLLELTDTTQNKDEKRYYNALRIYVYTIFENLWFGYLMSYPESEMTFKYGNVKFPNFQTPFSMYLPFFSAAILHFGSCRDIFFVLLQLCIKNAKDITNEEFERIINIHFYQWEKGKQKTNKKTSFIKDDLIKFSKEEDENSSFIIKGNEFFSLNKFRNYFAHRMRLLWWRSEECKQETFSIKKSIYEIFKGTLKEESPYEELFKILENPEQYQHDIEISEPDDLVSARQILQKTHDIIASFFSEFMEIMEKKLRV